MGCIQRAVHYEWLLSGCLLRECPESIGEFHRKWTGRLRNCSIDAVSAADLRHSFYRVQLPLIIANIQRQYKQHQLEPNAFIRSFSRSDHKRPVFFGNQSDYFQILGQDNDSLLIGARYVIKHIFHQLSHIRACERGESWAGAPTTTVPMKRHDLLRITHEIIKKKKNKTIYHIPEMPCTT